MRVREKTVLLCDCTGTMTIDGEAIRRGCGTAPDAVATYLCRGELRRFDAALRQGGPLLVACTQEAPFFTETRAEAGVDNDLSFVNIRERAGWSREGAAAGPKIAALIAEAALPTPPPRTVTLASEGTALVYGNDERAIEIARKLADRLDCTVLLADPANVLPPRLVDVPIFRGRVVSAIGHLGAFEIVVDGYAPVRPSSRTRLEFDTPRDGAASRCDVIIDLSGRPPLFPAPALRDGYLRVDPGDPAAISAAILAAAELSGAFEKPRYIEYAPCLCAHGRAGRTGCTRCIDVCPTAAIKPAGDTVEIDTRICAGCGACAGVCPTGAASYAVPPRAHVFERLHTLLTTYAKAGGTAPVLFVHDARHGEDVISMIARRGDGLPARVLPFALNEVTQVGVDLLLSALAWGCESVRLLVSGDARDDTAVLAQQVGLVETIMSGLGHGEDRVAIIDDADPEPVERLLYSMPRREAVSRAGFPASGTKRAVTTLALAALHAAASAPPELLALPAGAPFGAVGIDEAGCTLCLACVGTCPTGALVEGRDRATLRFVESACVQCGLCEATCPERVITLTPRLNFAADARAPVTLKDGPAVDRIGKCADYLTLVRSGPAHDPFAAPARPLARTIDDDLGGRDRPPHH